MNHDKNWLDERIKLGEVPRHLADDAAKRSLEDGFEADAAKLTESDQRILSEIPPERFAAEVLRRADAAKRIDRARRSAPSRAAWGGAAMAACLALAFVVTQDPLGPSTPSVSPQPVATTETVAPGVAPAATVATADAPQTTETVPTVPPVADWRTKGGVELVLQRESAEGLKSVTNSDTLASGTRLRLSVPRTLAWAAVYSIDARGEMAQHWPLQGSEAQPIAQGLLPRAWELDDAPGRETFVLVWSERPFGLDAVRKAIFLRRDAPRVAKGIQVFVTRVVKASGAKP